MKRLLAKTFKPALIASVPGSLVTVTTSLLHSRDKPKYRPLATLSYQGKKLVGGAKGKWQPQEYELLSFRYVRGGFRGSTARFKVGWGDQLPSGQGGGTGGIRKCPIGRAAFDSYAECVRAISAAGHRSPQPASHQRLPPTFYLICRTMWPACYISFLDGHVAAKWL